MKRKRKTSDYVQTKEIPLFVADKCIITKTKHPATGDELWKIQDISLPLVGIDTLIGAFINTYNHPDYSLSVYDTITGNTIEIDCDTQNIPAIAEYIYRFEKGFPFSFIGLHTQTRSYVVGMPFCRRRIEFGRYKDLGGRLEKIN